jgi:murein DD-endopeptidase MepM/ murein hydrolase activator NlpD
MLIAILKKFSTKLNANNIINYTILLFSLNIINLCYSQPLPKHNPIPGGIAIVPLDLESLTIPKVFFKDKQVLVVKYYETNPEPNNDLHNNWLAIIGIPMDSKAGLHALNIFWGHNTNNSTVKKIKKTFLVSANRYPTEKLKLDNKFVTPSYNDQLRINKELELVKYAYNYRSEAIPQLKLTLPVKGRKSSGFGTQRLLNGQARGFHSGLDLAAPTGTKIYAASKGKVILTGDFFYTGNVVFVEHGQGLITNYCHLDSIQVKEGDEVADNTVLGTVGATGRVTGPHLHWSVSLNDTRVNPELFTDL